MHRGCAPDRLSRRFGKAEEPDLARRDKRGHSANRLFYGRIGVDAVLIIEVDNIDAETLEAFIAALANISGPAIDTEEASILGPHIAEFRGEHNLLAPVPDGRAHQYLVGAQTVDVGGIEKGYTELDCTMDGGDRFAVVAACIEV